MTEADELRRAIAALESQRGVLGDAAVDAALAGLRSRLSGLEAPAAERRRVVTVLFADVAGFTAMSERMDAEDVRNVMNTLWLGLDAAITDHGGTIDKHIGDAVMAVFGAPVAQEDDPERAIRAALAMQSAVREMSDRHEEPLSMRIGIHTGPVVLGSVGSGDEYTALGDSVNLASRIEHAAAIGSILVSEDTYRHVRGVFDVTAQPPLTVKGKRDPVSVYLVDGAKRRAFRRQAETVEGLETPLVGRDEEMGRLQAAFEETCATGRGRAMTLVGEAGVGKSRLCWSFCEWLDLRLDPVWLFQGRARRDQQREPYVLLRDLLAFRFGFREGDPEANEHLIRGLEELLGDEGKEIAPFLGHLAGLDFRSEPGLSVILNDPGQIRARALHGFERLFIRLAEENPLVIVLDDLQWADDSSLDLVVDIVGRLSGRAALIVAAARPALLERRPDWAANWTDHETVRVRSLDDAPCRDLAYSMLRRIHEPPVELIDWLATSSAGNPFHLEELVRMLVEERVIVTGEESWDVDLSRLDASRTPPTLVAILQARLDALPQEEQQVIERAAVVGRVFWEEGVSALLPDVDMAPLFESLTRREILRPRANSVFPGTREYGFKSELLRDVAYERVLLRDRPGLHGQVAEWLATRLSSSSPAFAATVAEHFERAGRNVEAGTWFARAAQHAGESSAAPAALALGEKALALLADEVAGAGARLETLELTGRMHRHRAELDEAVAAFHTLVKEAKAAGDARAESSAWSWLAMTHGDRGDVQAGAKAVDQAEATARAAGPEARIEMNMAAVMRAWWHQKTGDTEGMRVAAERAVALARPLGDDTALTRSLNTLGVAHLVRGDHAAAEVVYGEALTLAERNEHHRAVVTLRVNLGELARQKADYALAIRHYQAAAEAARRIGERRGGMMARSNLAGALIQVGEAARAEPLLTEILAEAPPTWAPRPEALSFLAQARLALGRAADAVEPATQAVESASAQPEFLGLAWRALGEVAAAMDTPIAVGGDARHPAACFEASLAAIEAAPVPAERARTLRSWARYEAARSDAVRAESLWREALAIFEELGLHREIEGMATDPLYPAGEVEAGADASTGSGR